MEQRIIDLWDEFTHGGVDRRDFMHRLAGLAGGMSITLTSIAQLGYVLPLGKLDEAESIADDLANNYANTVYAAQSKLSMARPATCRRFRVPGACTSFAVAMTKRCRCSTPR